jgi:tyrosinase
MGLRKEVRSLNSEDRKTFVAALLNLKKSGRYDQYVHWHHAVMVPSIGPSEPADPDYRNGAHRGPSFLPWHREFLLQVEADLQKIDPAITIPYWNWTIDAQMDDPFQSPIWSADFMGGDGVQNDSWRVGTGPFAYSGNNWPIPVNHGGPALIRRFGFTVPTLPASEDVALAMSEAFYDTPPFNSSPFTVGFRNRLEGWVTQRGDSRVKFPGSQLHNRVHLWVGGSMLPMTSPNDPIFFLHHCFKTWTMC